MDRKIGYNTLQTLFCISMETLVLLNLWLIRKIMQGENNYQKKEDCYQNWRQNFYQQATICHSVTKRRVYSNLQAREISGIYERKVIHLELDTASKSWQQAL